MAYTPSSTVASTTPTDTGTAAPLSSITFFRHGKSALVELSGEKRVILREEGIADARRTAVEIAQRAATRHERILTFSSPRMRAMQTADILIEELRSRGVTIVPDQPIDGKAYNVVETLASPKLTEEFWQMNPPGEGFIPLWQELSWQNQLPEGSESYQQIEEKFRALLQLIVGSTVTYGGEVDAPLRIVCVCHFETLSVLFSAAYGKEFMKDRERRLRTSEYLDVDLLPSSLGHGTLAFDYIRGTPSEDGSTAVRLDIGEDYLVRRV